MAASTSAFSSSPLDGAQASTPLVDNDDLWEVFVELALEQKSKTMKSLDDSLNTLMLFAALFSAVNVGILAISIPTLNGDPNAGPPSEDAQESNRIFSSSLTCSLLAAFFSLTGKQWLRHYTRQLPTAQLENLLELQRELAGASRWYFKAFVEVGLMTLLQLSVILFLVEWIPYLHRQGGDVSHPDNGLAIAAVSMLVLMFMFALWDPWFPYQTPFTTALLPTLYSTFVSLPTMLTNIKFPNITFTNITFPNITFPNITFPSITFSSITFTRETFRNIFQRAFHELKDFVGMCRSHLFAPLSNYRRPEETCAFMDELSLNWLMENAPRGRPLRLVALQISQIGSLPDIVMHSPHIHRLHKMFWDASQKLLRATREKGWEGVNEETEILRDMAIFGKCIVATSHQGIGFTVENAMQHSFETYATVSRHNLSWDDVHPLLNLQRRPSVDGTHEAYFYPSNAGCSG